MENYCLCAAFSAEETANTVYQHIQSLLASYPQVDVSCSEPRWLGSLQWVVIVLGQRPPHPIQAHLLKILSKGKAIDCPIQPLIRLLEERHQQKGPTQ